jgi:hypothetical protein
MRFVDPTLQAAIEAWRRQMRETMAAFSAAGGGSMSCSKPSVR